MKQQADIFGQLKEETVTNGAKRTNSSVEEHTEKRHKPGPPVQMSQPNSMATGTRSTLECDVQNLLKHIASIAGSNLHLTTNTGSVKCYHGPEANTHGEK